jgi:hypothetical protein
MALTSTINNNGVANIAGVKKVVTGTFTQVSIDTGGDIETGLRRVEHFTIQEIGTAVVANKSVVNETFPTATGSITIVTDAGVTGVWRAEGE